MFVLNDFLNWMWCLCIVSEINPLRDTAYGFLFENRHGHSLFNWLVFTFVWGYMAGINGLAGHELIHRRDPFNKLIGMFAFTKILYSHFLLEHANGHHRNVATQEDPATALHGETLYSFAVRSAIGGHVNTYKREVNRITAEFEDCYSDRSQKKQKVPQLSLITQNRMLWFFILHVSILTVIWFVFGYKGVLFQLAYASVGIFFLEMTNYIEHYGLLRKRDARGIYEPITEQHSWNSCSSTLLFRIQRHSDHHVHAYRPY